MRSNRILLAPVPLLSPPLSSANVVCGVFPARSLKRIFEVPTEIPRTLLALARSTLWCCVGGPLRLLVMWIAAAKHVIQNDEAGWRARDAAARRAGRSNVEMVAIAL